MREVELVVRDLVGLHAQPAAIISRESRKYVSNIKIKYNGKFASALSVFEIISLGVMTNSVIVLSAEGKDESLAIESMEYALREQGVIF